MKSSRRMWVRAGMCLLALAVISIAADSTSPLRGSIARPPAYPPRDFSNLPLWDVVKVLAPDTILISKGQTQQTVKLLGVSAVQANVGKAVSARRPYNSRAVEFLNNLLAAERVYVMDNHPRIARTSGLKLVKIFRAPDGLYVNLELVRQGYMRMAPAGLAGERRLFETYQARARLAGKGLWSKLIPPTPATTLPGVTTVYITKSGKKYHRRTCQFLAKSKISINLIQAKQRKYTPCKICKPPP